MPWYKMFGNRTLTTIQNALTGLRLSEYHTGYRGYSTRFLKKVPFESNTNVFHFDTQILVEGNRRVEDLVASVHEPHRHSSPRLVARQRGVPGIGRAQRNTAEDE